MGHGVASELIRMLQLMTNAIFYIDFMAVNSVYGENKRFLCDNEPHRYVTRLGKEGFFFSEVHRTKESTNLVLNS